MFWHLQKAQHLPLGTFQTLRQTPSERFKPFGIRKHLGPRKECTSFVGTLAARLPRTQREF